MKTKLAPQAKQVVPLLEELTYFLEQYRFTPTLLSQNVKGMVKPLGKNDEKANLGENVFSGPVLSSGPAYDYETLCMIMSEAQSFSLALKLGMSEIEWLSSVESINSVVLQWLSHLYRIPTHLSPSFIVDLNLTRQKILLTALTAHYPSYPKEGYLAFGDTTPVIICTHLVPWVSTLVSLLGLPRSTIRVGPKALDQLSPKTVVVAVFWILPDPTDPITWNEAQTDALISFVHTSGAWLHAEGYDTILMSSIPDPSQNVVAHISDSLIVDASELLQIDRYACPTLFSRREPRTPPKIYSSRQPSLDGSIGTTSIGNAGSELTNEGKREDHQHASNANLSVSESMASDSVDDALSEFADLSRSTKDHLHLDLWFAIQLKGYSYLSQLVSSSSQLCEILYRRIGVSPSFRILESADKSNTKLHIRYEFPYRHLLPTPDLSQSNDHSDVKEENPVDESLSASGTESIETETDSNFSKAKQNRASKRFFQSLEIDDEKVTEFLFHYIQSMSSTPLPLELKRLNADGKLYIAWNPIRCYHLHHLTRSHVNTFADMMNNQAAIISSTFKCREAFESEIKQKSDCLMLVSTNPPNYVGLGAVRYVPEFVSALEEEFGKQAQRWKPIVDDLNMGILNEVLQIHPLYYAATSTHGEQAIGLHLDSSEMTPEKVHYHIQLITETALRIETELHFLDRIGDIVKEGIKEAQEAIHRSNANRASQKGVVRSLPLVGRVWNWWSPIKPLSSEGANFDLLTSQQPSEQSETEK